MKKLYVDDFVDRIQKAVIKTQFSIEEIYLKGENQVKWGYIWNELCINSFKAIYRNTLELSSDNKKIKLTSKILDVWEIKLDELLIVGKDGVLFDDSQIQKLLEDNTEIELFNYTNF